jgi:hypothetical protein
MKCKLSEVESEDVSESGIFYLTLSMPFFYPGNLAAPILQTSKVASSIQFSVKLAMSM